MPVKVSRVKGGFRVATPHGVKAKKTTKFNAKKLKRLLQALKHGFVPSKRARPRRAVQ